MEDWNRINLTATEAAQLSNGPLDDIREALGKAESLAVGLLTFREDVLGPAEAAPSEKESAQVCGVIPTLQRDAQRTARRLNDAIAALRDLERVLR